MRPSTYPRRKKPRATGRTSLPPLIIAGSSSAAGFKKSLVSAPSLQAKYTRRRLAVPLDVLVRV